MLAATTTAVPATAATSSTTTTKKTTASYVVVLSDGAVPAAVAGATRALGGDIGFTYSHALQGFSVRLPAALAPALAALPGVASVSPDAVVRASGTQSPTPSYGLDRTDQRALPLSNSYTSTATGAGVTAYIIDTGLNLAHRDFTGRVGSGFDAVDGGTPDDCNGHGTHVSGTVGGTTYGIAKSVTLVPVRVLDCGGSGSTSGVIAGVDWVTGNHAAGAPAVANMSLGGGTNTALDTAVKNAIADGVTFGVAAGNNGGFVGDLTGSSNACNGSPSRVPTALTVGATDASDTRASYSNSGTCLDLFAPGSSITSDWMGSPTATNTISGTSMATPHVVGVAALYLAGNRSASPATVASVLTSKATAGIVKSPGTGSPNRLLFSDF